MPLSDDNPRSRLGFADAVATPIAPNLISLGFACSEATSCAVKFESAQVVISLYHDRRDYEIDVRFVLKSDPSKRISLHDLIYAAIGPDREEKSFFQASSDDRVLMCLKHIAEIMGNHGQNVLAGESSAYQRIADVARLRDKAFTKQVVQNPIRNSAEAAWKNHEYGNVQRLYESIGADLTPLEKKRLDYAKGSLDK